MPTARFPTAQDLLALPVQQVGQFGDLHLTLQNSEWSNVRFFVMRGNRDDGYEWDNTVQIEARQDPTDLWDHFYYDGDNPPKRVFGNYHAVVSFSELAGEYAAEWSATRAAPEWCEDCGRDVAHVNDEQQCDACAAAPSAGGDAS